MKTSTILILAVGGAAVLFLALQGRGSASGGATATGRAAPAQDSGSSRDQLERTAIQLGGQLGGKLLDSLFGDERGAITV